MHEVEVMVDGLGFPEGPIAMPDGSLLFVDMCSKALCRLWGEGKVEVVATTGGGPNGAAIGPDGAVYICNNGGADIRRGADGKLVFGPLPADYSGGYIQRVDLDSRKVERIYDQAGDNHLSSPNDLVFDSHGGMWFTDMGRPLGRTRSISGVYYAKADGSFISEQFFGGISYNGIGLSADETALYVADTYPARLWRFDLAEAGRMARVRGAGPWPAYVATLPGHIEVDSLALTESGRVCMATLHTGGIAIVTPNGEVSQKLLPDDIVTNICFGGPDMQTVYVTAPGRGQIFRMRWDEPGLRLNYLNK